MDDSQVRPVSWKTVSREPAYLLFYVRMADTGADEAKPAAPIKRVPIGPMPRPLDYSSTPQGPLQGPSQGPLQGPSQGPSQGPWQTSTIAAVWEGTGNGFLGLDDAVTAPSAPPPDDHAPAAKRARLDDPLLHNSGDDEDDGASPSAAAVETVLHARGWVESATHRVQQLLSDTPEGPAEDEAAFVERVRSRLLPRLQEEAMALWEQHHHHKNGA